MKVFIDTSATNQGDATIEAVPESAPVNLESGASASFAAVWEYDMTSTSKEELAALMDKNVIRAEWTNEDMKKHEETLTGD